MKRKFFLAMLVCFFLAAGCAKASELEITFFNVGKADSFLLKTANSTVLIDAATNKKGKEIVQFLSENGVNQIDALIITHFDKDHVGGADQILQSIRVSQVYQPCYESDSKQFTQYAEALSQSSTAVHVLRENMMFEIDGVSYLIDVANQSFYGDDEENDFSLVLSVQHGENSFLFAGDAENPRLNELLSEGVGKHRVLKVPHHGKSEKSSAAFFAAVQPEFSIITSDDEELEEENVVRRLEQFGTVYLTRLGTVHCVSDGINLTFTQE